MNIYPLFKKKIENIANEKLIKALISFENQSNLEEFIKKYQNLNLISKYSFIPVIYTEIKKEKALELEKEELIKQIEENQRLHLSMLDVMETLELDHYHNNQILYTGTRAKVGIIDDGINYEFPAIPKPQVVIDSNNNEINSTFFENEITHGSIMASIICNQFKDLDGNYISIAPNVNLIDFRLAKKDNKYYISDILNVFDKIKKNNLIVDILLIPLTTSEPSDGEDILSICCNLLVNEGMIIISVSGNFGPDKYTIGSPGAAEKVLTVGALTKSSKIANFSGKGPTLDGRIKPDLSLPGSDISIPLSKDLKVKATGTSISAAIGTGIIALLKDYNPKITYHEIMELLKKSSIDLNYDPDIQGMGMVKITKIFAKLGLLNGKLVPYSYLVKKSIKLSLEILSILIIIVLLFIFFRI
ncbi:MAG: S8 family serine peptidase [Promethearchaeota archaeon]